MKKTILFSLIIFFALITTNVVHAETSTTYPDVKLSLVNQDPDPVKSGDLVDVRIKVDNFGKYSANDVAVEFIPDYPFTLYTGSNKINIGSLSGLQSDEHGVVLKYTIKVDKNAVEGQNKISFKVNYEGKSSTFNFYINIQTVDSTISINSVKTIPDKISPGSKGKIVINLKNIADSTIKDINFKIDLTGESFSTTTVSPLDYLTYFPFSPINSSTEKKIIQLGSNETKDIIFNFAVDSNAISKVYKLPIIFSYYDELGNKIEKKDLIGIEINSEPETLITLDRSDVHIAGDNGKVIIKIANKGIDDLKFLSIKLNDIKDLNILSANEVYVGQLDSDDFETAEYSVYVNNGDKDITLPLTIEFKDSLNNKHTFNQNITLPIYNEDEAMILGFKQKSTTTGMIITILILVAGLFVYFKYFRKKK